MSCVSAPKDVSRADFEGEWRQVDGSSVITFKDKNWELVDLERGIAGYGTFNLEDWTKDTGEYVIKFGNHYFVDLNGDSLGSNPKDFIVKAWEEYKVHVSERIMGHFQSTGTLYFAFELNGNNLKLWRPSGFGASTNPSIFIQNLQTSRIGDFVRAR